MFSYFELEDAVLDNVSLLEEGGVLYAENIVLTQVLLPSWTTEAIPNLTRTYGVEACWTVIVDETVLPVDILVVLVAMASVLYTMTISVDKLKIVSDSVIMAVSVSMMT